MLRFILFLILFYILFRVIRMVIRYFLLPKKDNPAQEEKTKQSSKYKDVQDAEFREIKKDN